MNKEGPILMLRAAVVAVWILAAVALLRAGVAGLSAPGRVRARLQEAKAVRKVEQRVEAVMAAREAYVRLHGAARKPADLEALAKHALAGAEGVKAEAQPALDLDGAQAHRFRVEAGQAPLAALSLLIEGAESAGPPWRLTGLRIDPDAPRPGKGRIRLDFEAVVYGDKTEPEKPAVEGR